MSDDESSEYLRRFPPWEKMLRELPGLGNSINPLLRVWWYKELEYLPVHTVLWQMAQGLLPVRNFGKTGQRRLREALRAAGIPEPIPEPVDRMDSDHFITMTIKCHPGHAKHYGILAIILKGDIEEGDQFGHDIVNSLHYWLDLAFEMMLDEDTDALKIALDKVARRIERWRATDPPAATE